MSDPKEGGYDVKVDTKAIAAHFMPAVKELFDNGTPLILSIPGNWLELRTGSHTLATALRPVKLFTVQNLYVPVLAFLFEDARWNDVCSIKDGQTEVNAYSVRQELEWRGYKLVVQSSEYYDGAHIIVTSIRNRR